MSATAQTQVNSITTRNYPKTSVGNVNAQDGLSPVFMDKTSITDYGERFQLSGINFSPEEMHELGIFNEFLSHHVLKNKISDVQCILLWNEWVRTFLRQTHEFPKLILENEFRTVVEEHLGAGIVNEDFRGAVYTGIKFVP
ncbi:MAG: hypothetical protein WC626_11045 [Methanoregula sp.]